MKIITEIGRTVVTLIGAIVMLIAIGLFVAVVVPAVLGGAAVFLGARKASDALHLTNRKPETAP